MIIIACVDDNNGMLFHQRRQSRDIALYNRILQLTEGKRLLMNEYSAKQFLKEQHQNIIVQSDFLDIALEQDYCFVENVDISQYGNDIQKIILYRWNRVYPADYYFQFPINEDIWKLQKVSDIKGNSHDMITEEVYTNV
ncbi:ribonuclease Z [Lachnospiraceae bacterium 46-61]